MNGMTMTHRIHRILMTSAVGSLLMLTAALGLIFGR
jgi:hypothetical protein